MISMRIDGPLLERRLDELYAIGAEPDGGTYRPLYGDAWARAVERVERWMKDAGLQAHRDPVGNVWGRAEGHNKGKAIVTGSHIDTVRHGGDRKSTRLNSSHSQISYAVFCLKKKKNHR